MAGRHHQAGTPTRRRSLLATTVVLAMAFAVAVGTLIFAGTRPHPVRVVSKVIASSCTGSARLTLRVQAAPAVAVPVARTAHDWSAHSPAIGGRCIDVELSSDPVDQQELAVQAAGSAVEVWIPDATVWAQRLAAAVAATPGNTLRLAVHPSIAQSPLVAVAAPDRAAQLASALARPDYDPLAGAQLPEPSTNAEGLLALLSTTPAAVADTPAAQRALVARLITVSKKVLDSAQNGFDQLAGASSASTTFVASEQAVIERNRQHGGLFAVAVYPTKPTLALDFPVVRLSRPGDDPALAQAADLFEAQLRSSQARSYFAGAGLRAADGSPVPGAGATDGVTADLVPPLPQPSPTQTVGLVRLWKAATADTSTLAVIDLSGSMADPAGGGRSKIAVAASAAAQAVSFFPDTSSLGLWVFSSDQGGATPWAQLVPLGPLGERLGSTTRRQALLAGAAAMAGRVHGGTALYDTVLAAYRQVQSQYDPSKVNAVVLMTDGRNEDTRSSTTLDQLMASLTAAKDPARPVKVITIGIGSGADAAALQRISTVTGGAYFPVQDPAAISDVFLDAVAQRQ